MMSLHQKRLAYALGAFALIINVLAIVAWKQSEDHQPNIPNPTPSAPITSATSTNEPIENNLIPDIKNEAFIATTEGDVLNILIFDPIENKIAVSKKITLDAFLGPASTNSYGANDSVQYNPKTKEIFFSTQDIQSMTVHAQIKIVPVFPVCIKLA